MKRVLAGVLLFILVASVPTFACSSFVVYFDEPIYGMNLDISSSDVTFMLLEDEDLGATCFVLLFWYKELYYGSNFVMTSKGQFRSSQEQSPKKPGKEISDLDPDEAFLIFFFSNQLLAYDLEDSLQWLEDKRLVHRHDVCEHLLLADVDGRAAIIEVGDEKNEIIPMVDDFLVMTNFKNSDFRDVPYNQIKATSSDRYQKIYEHILANRDNFDVDTAFEALRKARTPVTKCSMVFVPRENNIYFALNGSFEKLWRLSLLDKTIYTYKGHGEPQEHSVPEEGITGSYLSEFARKNLLEQLKKKE